VTGFFFFFDEQWHAFLLSPARSKTLPEQKETKKQRKVDMHGGTKAGLSPSPTPLSGLPRTRYYKARPRQPLQHTTTQANNKE